MRVSLPALAFLFLLSQNISAQSPLGTWATIDDETGAEKSHVQIYEKDGKHFGKVVRMVTAQNHNCDRCTDHRKDQPILGMVIIENMELKNGMWQGGKVLFPKQGKWYSMKYWLAPGDSDTLILRGFIGPFFRTQTWRRVAG